jgi:excisionase family DNA binding protein
VGNGFPACNGNERVKTERVVSCDIGAVSAITTQPKPETAQAGANATPQGFCAPSPLPSLPARLYMRKDELAAWLGVSISTIEEWMRGKVIPFVKVNRTTLFRVDAVDRALQKFTIKAVGDFQKA